MKPRGSRSGSGWHLAERLRGRLFHAAAARGLTLPRPPAWPTSKRGRSLCRAGRSRLCAVWLPPCRQLLAQLALHGPAHSSWHGAVEVGVSGHLRWGCGSLGSGSGGLRRDSRRLLLLLLLALALLASCCQLLRQLALQAAPCCCRQTGVVSSSQAGIHCLCLVLLGSLLLGLLLRQRWQGWQWR